MGNINLWAVLAATLSTFIVGGVWYSKSIFGKIWNVEAGDPCSKSTKGHRVVVFVVSFFLSLAAVVVFALFIGPKPTFFHAVGTGFAIGLFWVASSFGTNYLFSSRSLKLLLIDGGYYVAQFTLFGIILGLWQ